MSEDYKTRPKVGDRVRVVWEGEVRIVSGEGTSVGVQDDKRSSYWVDIDDCEVLTEGKPDLVVGRVELFQALGRPLMESEWDQWLDYAAGWDNAKQREMLPAFVQWRHEIQGPDPVRSDTAIERRLVALEEDSRVHARTLDALERKFAELRQKSTASHQVMLNEAFNTRIGKLEGMLGELRQVFGED